MSYSDTFMRKGISLHDVADSVRVSILCLKTRNDNLAQYMQADQQQCTDGVVLSIAGSYLRHSDRYAIFRYQDISSSTVEWFMTHPWSPAKGATP